MGRRSCGHLQAEHAMPAVDVVAGALLAIAALVLRSACSLASQDAAAAESGRELRGKPR